MTSNHSISVFTPRISLFSPIFCFFVVLGFRLRSFYFSLYLKFNRSSFYRYVFVLKSLIIFSFSSPLRFICFLFVCFLLTTFKALASFVVSFSFVTFLFWRGVL